MSTVVVVVVTSVGVLFVEYVVFGVVVVVVLLSFDMLVVEFVLSVVTGEVYEEFVVAPVVE
ncbi:hypothetical protein GCM10028816_13080 [Spirosoma lituiforme]